MTCGVDKPRKTHGAAISAPPKSVVGPALKPTACNALGTGDWREPVGSTVREAMVDPHSFEAWVDGDSKDHTEVNIDLQFAGFQLQPRARLLTPHGRPVDIGDRAFDMLHGHWCEPVVAW